MVRGPGCAGGDPGRPSPSALTKPSSCVLCVVSRYRLLDDWRVTIGGHVTMHLAALLRSM